MALWLVRCGRHGEGESVALEEGIVGIGWADAGDLTAARTPDDIRAVLATTHPDAKRSTVSNWVGQLHAFRSRIQIGDLVALPLKSSPAVAFGRVTGDYRYVPDSVASVRQQRSVHWIREDVPRDAIDQDLLYSLGAFLTVCRIQRNDAEVRIRALLDGRPIAAPPAVSDESSAETADETGTAPVDLGELGRDQIRKRLAERFHGHDFARLVGQILQAEDFVCDVSPAGPDGGVDILAGEGGMGFDGANLAVQVKSGAVVVDAPTLRELQGVMRNFGAANGLMVSWGGFTKGARAEARRLFFQIRLWDSDAVIDKVQEVYDRLPADTQAQLPLRRVWSLVPDDLR